MNEKITNLLETQRESLTWHDGAIPEKQVWIKVEGDHGQGCMKLNYRKSKFDILKLNQPTLGRQVLSAAALIKIKLKITLHHKLTTVIVLLAITATNTIEQMSKNDLKIHSVTITLMHWQSSHKRHSIYTENYSKLHKVCIFQDPQSDMAHTSHPQRQTDRHTTNN